MREKQQRNLVSRFWRDNGFYSSDRHLGFVNVGAKL